MVTVVIGGRFIRFIARAVLGSEGVIALSAFGAGAEGSHHSHYHKIAHRSMHATCGGTIERSILIARSIVESTREIF